MKHKKIVLAFSVFLTVLCLGFAQFFKTGSFMFIGIARASDAYGNAINSIEIYQDGNLLINATSTNQTLKIDGNKAVLFHINIQFNVSLFSGDTNDTRAIEYTKVTMNITQDVTEIWNNVELNNSDVSHDATYYYLSETGYWNDDLPEDGKTYICTIRLDTYY